MKIATFNINNVNTRFANLLALLGESRPDVVCLQELKCEQRAFPERALQEAHDEHPLGSRRCFA